MIENIVIFGGHIQALGLARQAKNENLAVYLIIPDKWSIAKHSNNVDKAYICRDSEDIMGILETFKGQKTLLFPTSDDYVEFLTENYNILSNNFTLGIPEPSCTTIFSNKRNTYRFCEEHCIPHPKSYYPESLDDVIFISNTIEYPIVVKPAIMYSFHKKFGKKAFLCHSSEELVSKCQEVEQGDYPINDLVIQEYLSGGAPSLFSFGTYCKNGEPVAWIQANRIRQNPMDFGNSTTFAISCNIPEIEASARKILKAVNYTGLAEVEFMYDEKSRQYKFLEINARAWKWHTLSEAFGFGFLSEMIRKENGKDSRFNPSLIRKAWTERFTDITIIIKESLKFNMNPVKAIWSYKIPKVFAVWSWKDPLPAIMYVLMSPILYIKRY